MGSPDDNAIAAKCGVSVDLVATLREAITKAEGRGYNRAIEDAANVAERQIPEPGLSENPAYVRFDPSSRMVAKIAAAIRALVKEG